MGELFVENQYRNPEGNPYYWDILILEKVQAEENIQLFLNTDVHEVEADGNEKNRTIKSVTGWMMGSERRIRFDSNVYLDCTGDGLIGFLAGARYRLGRETSDEFNESLAPLESYDILLGSTILFYTRDEGFPVKYVPPAFAKDITKTPIPMNRIIRSGDSGCHYWWIEWGGELDTVHDNERIRDELWSVIYGIWDYIKNSGKFEAENLTLEWVGSIPGKREYRRFVGDYILNQNDILEQNLFDDRVAFGGWSIDLHPPKGMYDDKSGAHHVQPDGNYHIPFRSLYSENVSNLLFAGRNISATHIAFGTTRVMATCAIMGEAAGTGAALAVQKNKTPKEIHKEHMEELQQILLRQEGAILGVSNQDQYDQARIAEVSASSTLKAINVEQADEEYSLLHDIGFMLPAHKNMQSLQILATVLEATTLEIELWDTGKRQNYIPMNLMEKQTIEVEKGKLQWIDTTLSFDGLTENNVFIIVKANEHLNLHLSHQPVTGVLSFYHREVKKSNLHSYSDSSKILEWTMKGMERKVFCMRTSNDLSAYEPQKIINGYVRPYGGPNIWVSNEMDDGQEEWIDLKWDQSITLKEIQLTFNDDVNEDLINLHRHRTPFEIIPELVRDYRIEAYINGKWTTILSEQDNRKRKRVHILPDHIQTERIRLFVEKTNGCPRAEVIEVRAYSEAISLKEV